MPLISQSVDAPNDGVSRAPQQRRRPGAAQELNNALASMIRGLSKRPGTTHISKLLASTGNENAFLHPIIRGDSEKYLVALVGGALKVFNADTGVEQTVTSVGTVTYVTGASRLRALTVGDTTYLVNPDTTVATLSRTSPVLKREALLFVRDASAATTYAVTLDGKSVSVAVAEEAGNAATIAQQLYEKLLASFSASYTITRYGATIHVQRTDGRAFKILTDDGLNDTGLRVVQGSIQRFEDLPARAKDGFVVEVTGDPESVFDNYWVRYDESEAAEGDGVWREAVQPGAVVALDPATMPHRLTLGGSYIQPEAVCKRIPTIGAGVRATPLDESKDSFDTSDAGAVGIAAVKTKSDHATWLSRTTAVTSNRTLVQYNVNTVGMTAGSTLEVTVSVGGSAQDIRSYGPEGTWDEVVDVGAVASGTVVRLDVNYAGGATPASPGVVTANGNTANTPAILHYTTNAYWISLEPFALYPKGYVATATILATPFVYTLASDMLGVDVALGLKALINASYTTSTPEPGVIQVDTANAVTAASNCDTGLVAWIDNGDFSGLAGLTVKNLTDGSSGVVASAAGPLIFAVSLTNGQANKFYPGHRVEVVGAGTYFVLTKAQWREREVGDLVNNPWPSFVGKKINSAFDCQNRLGLISGDSIVLSQATDRANFFRQTAKSLLPDDLIDVKSAINFPSDFHDVFEWNGSVILRSDMGVFELSGDPALTPTTVRLDLISEIPNARNVAPVVAGSRVFMAYNRPSSDGQVLEILRGYRDEALTIDDATKDCPGYLPGNILQLTGDGSFGFLCARMQDDRDALYVYLYRFFPDGSRAQASWSRWDFTGSPVISVLASNGTLTLALQRPDGVYLERVDLLSAIAFDP